jgi:hypothetical protein
LSVAVGESRRLAQMESTSVMYTGQLNVADQSAHVLRSVVLATLSRWHAGECWKQMTISQPRQKEGEAGK